MLKQDFFTGNVHQHFFRNLQQSAGIRHFRVVIKLCLVVFGGGVLFYFLFYICKVCKLLYRNTQMITKIKTETESELQIRGGIEDNSKIIFLIFQ